MIGVADCDEWRRNYHTWTLEQHKDFYRRIYADYPGQSHADHSIMHMVYDIFRPRTVVEIGGWDGELAVAMLTTYPEIEKWTNVEVCEQAVENGHKHDRYWPVSPNRWFWEEGPWDADMLVASHCIEHMTAEHLRDMVEACTVDYMYFDAPLVDQPLEWMGTSTTHILEVGWDGVTQICADAGYRLIWAYPHATPPESGGHARAVVYSRMRHTEDEP